MLIRKRQLLAWKAQGDEVLFLSFCPVACASPNPVSVYRVSIDIIKAHWRYWAWRLGVCNPWCDLALVFLSHSVAAIPGNSPMSFSFNLFQKG